MQAAADRFTARLIQERLDYWTFVLGPKFATRERRAMNLRRFYAIGQVEYLSVISLFDGVLSRKTEGRRVAAVSVSHFRFPRGV